MPLGLIWGIKLTRFIMKRLVQGSYVPCLWAFYGTTRCNIHQVRISADVHLVDHQIPDTDLKPKARHPLAFGILRWLIQLDP